MSDNTELDKKIIYIVGSTVRKWAKSTGNKTYQNKIENEAKVAINKLIQDRYAIGFVEGYNEASEETRKLLLKARRDELKKLPITEDEVGWAVGAEIIEVRIAELDKEIGE